MIPTVYGEQISCPRILRVGNNTIATTGDWVISEYVVDDRFDDFINGLNKRFNFAIKTNNRLYYHFTCTHKNTTFNIITSRVKGVKSGGKILYTLNGETKLLSEWCKIYNINYQTAWKKSKKGYSIEKILKIEK